MDIKKMSERFLHLLSCDWAFERWRISSQDLPDVGDGDGIPICTVNEFSATIGSGCNG